MNVRRADPRLYQITSLALLLGYGLLSLDFEVAPSRVVLLLTTVLVTQLAASRLARIPFEPKSALISGLSLCLLLRTGSPLLAAAAGVLTIASKFLLRVGGKHVFNPTNFGIVALLLLSDGVWVSPGQWGNAAFLGFLFACLGSVVVTRASRADVTFAFLLCWAALLAGRSLWVGEPLTIPLHRLQSGALLLFAFFMISDPKTTPDSRAGRFLFAALVALGAWYWQFRLFRTNGLLLSLAAFSLVVPVLDRLVPGPSYRWTSISKGVPDEAPPAADPVPALAAVPAPAPVGGLLRLLRGQGGHQTLQ